MDINTFQVNPLWEIIEDAQTKIKFWPEDNNYPESISSNTLAEVTVLLSAISAFKQLRNPVFISSNAIDSINSAVQQFSNQLQNSKSSNYGNQDQRFQSLIDDIQNNLGGFVLAFMQEKRPTAIMESSAKDAVQEIQAAATKANTNFKSISEKSENFVQEKTQEIESQLQESKTVAKNLEDRVKDVITEYKTEIDQYKVKIEKEQVDKASPYVLELEGILNDVKTYKADLEKIKADVEDLAEVKASGLMSKNYRKQARWEKGTGFISYFIGLIIVGIGGYVTLKVSGDLLNHTTISLAQAIVKATLAFLTGGSAAVVFRLGANSFKKSTEFKRQQLELFSLDPLIANIGTDLKDPKTQIKKDFIDRSYGKAWTEIKGYKAEVENNDEFSQALIDAAKIIVEKSIPAK